MSQCLFPLSNAEDYLRSCDFDVQREGGHLRWTSGDGQSELHIQMIDKRTFDGLTVSELVTLTHVSEGLKVVTPELSASMNRNTMLSSIICADADKPARMVTKVGIFSTDQDAAEHVYAPLICQQAALMGWHAQVISSGEGDRPIASPLSQNTELPPYDAADFQACASFTDRLNCLSSLGNHHFTVEFPRAPGAASNMFLQEEVRSPLIEAGSHSESDLDRLGGQTSLLQICFDEHPYYGKGIRSLLEIPIWREFSDQLISELNQWELSGADLPPPCLSPLSRLKGEKP